MIFAWRGTGAYAFIGIGCALLFLATLSRGQSADKASPIYEGQNVGSVDLIGNPHRDLEPVELSITTPWSNGPIEWQISRPKAIKRQVYGRAGFELLKATVLPWISKAG